MAAAGDLKNKTKEKPFLWSLWFLFVLCSKVLVVQTLPAPVSLLCPWADARAGLSLLVLWPSSTEEDSCTGGGV